MITRMPKVPYWPELDRWAVVCEQCGQYIPFFTAPGEPVVVPDWTGFGLRDGRHVCSNPRCCGEWFEATLCDSM